MIDDIDPADVASLKATADRVMGEVTGFPVTKEAIKDFELAVQQWQSFNNMERAAALAGFHRSIAIWLAQTVTDHQASDPTYLLAESVRRIYETRR